MKARQLAATAVAIAASLTLAACGGSSYTPLTQSTFAKAISDAAHNVQTVHMNMSAPSMSADADFGYGTSTTIQMNITASSGGQTTKIAIRLIGSSFYMQLPPVTPAGKWVKFNANANGANAIQQYKNYGPQGLANQFKTGVKSITYVGAAQIAGQQVQHYTVVADPAQLGASLTALAKENATFANIKSITEQVYLTDQNLVQRIAVTFPAPIGTIQIDFTKWGDPVSITAPASGDVITAPAS